MQSCFNSILLLSSDLSKEDKRAWYKLMKCCACFGDAEVWKKMIEVQYLVGASLKNSFDVLTFEQWRMTAYMRASIILFHDLDRK